MNDHRTRDTRPVSEVRLWAVANDSFMSGWGQAPGRSLVAYPIDLHDGRHSEILNWMRRRGDFKRVRVNMELPELREGDHLSIYDVPDGRL
jgi:hypothetical protein